MMRRDLQVALGAGSGADADGLIGELDVHGVDVRLGIDGDGFDIEFLAGADDAEGDFTAVGDEDFAEHGGKGRRLEVMGYRLKEI